VAVQAAAEEEAGDWGTILVLKHVKTHWFGGNANPQCTCISLFLKEDSICRNAQKGSGSEKVPRF